MRLTRLDMLNWCLHRNKSIEFGDVTLLRGQNGQGKTSVINAIAYATLGINRVPGNVTEHITKGQKHSELSVEFTHAGNSLHVVRRLSSDSSAVEVEYAVNDDPMKNVKIRTLDSVLSQLFGVGRDFFDNHVIVAQDQLTSFLTDRQAVRERFFSSLFDLEKADMIREAVASRIEKMGDSLPAQQDVAMLKNMLDDQTKVYDSVRTEVESIEKELGALSESQAESSETKRAYEAAQSYAAMSQHWKNDIATHLRRVEELTKQEASLKQTRALAEAAWHGLKQAAPDARAVRAAWKAYADYLVSSRKEKEQLADATGRLADERLKLDGVTPYEPSPDRIAQLLTEAESGVRAARSQLHALSSGECPTCGTSCEEGHLKDKVRELNDYVARFEPSIAKLREELDRARRAESLISASTRNVERLEGELQFYRKRVDSLQPMAAPDVTMEEADESERELLKAYDAFTSVDKTYRDVSVSRRTVSASLTGSTNALRDLERSVSPSTTPGEALYKNACEQLDRQRFLSSTLKSTKSKRDYAEKTIGELRTKLAATEADERERNSLLDCRKRFRAIRDLFSRSELGAKVIDRGLRRIVKETNTVLDYFGASIVVKEVSGTVFELTESGKPTPPHRLSRGQRTILALAVRVAIHSVMSSGAGLLVLDEPTEGLDANNRRLLAKALERLRSRNSDVQLVLVSHDRCLDSLADVVIDV